MFIARAPSVDLGLDVALLWTAQGATTPAAREWILPSGTAQLLINVARERLTFHASMERSESLSGVALCGPFSIPHLVDASEQDDVCGVSFTAVGLAKFIGVPAHEVHNQMVGLGDLGVMYSERTLAEVRQAESAELRLDSLERFVRGLAGPIAPPDGIRWAARQLDDPTRRVREIAEEGGFSRRGLVDQFRRVVGMTPKRYQRVRRFRGALAELDGRGPIVDVAHRCGFHDQAHLAHEFGELARMSPTDYRARRTGYSGHVMAEE